MLWTSKPVRMAFLLYTWSSIPFGLLFLGFSLFWTWGAYSARGSDSFYLFGLIFVLIGAGITFGPTIWQLASYRNTEYMITDRRTITQTGAVGVDTRFVSLDRVQEIYVKIGLIDKMFGTGSVYALTAGYSALGSGDGTMGSRPSLRALKEPYQVQKLLQQAMEQARKK